MMTKPLLGVILFFEVFLAQGLTPYPDSYYRGGYGGGASFFGSSDSLENVFQGQDTSQIFSPTLQGGGNQLSQGNSIQSLLAQTQQIQDPSLATGCGMAPLGCPQTRYRSYDGSCNNLRNPVLGTPQTPYTRLLPPNYADGIAAPTRARSDRELPLSRTLSLVLFPDIPIEDPRFTLAAMQYGQIITHDMSMIAGSTQSTPHQTRCCTDDGQILQGVTIPEHCYPLIFPPDDPQTLKSNIRCSNFVRTLTTRDRRCVGPLQPGEQLTVVNHFLDLSIVYGNTDQVDQQVRQFQGGRLRVAQRNGKDWLPQNPNVTGTCPGVQSFDEPCYLAGDQRVNQNPQLTVIQIILLREHNRLAGVLAHLNPHWDDERIFQEARRINIAEHQHITYYEWLPIFLGIENSLKNRIIYDTKDFVNDYNENVDPTVINEHATAAFRFFHDLIVGRLDLVAENRNSFGNIRLSDWFNRPAVLEQANNFDDLTRGLTTQPERKSTQFADSEITQFLFRMVNRMFGQDLRAIDIQRNRDHGLASYNDYRVFCGLSKANSFEDFLDVIAPENVQKLAKLYERPDDVDLTVGGSLERLVPGTLSGPVFLCILTEQFYRTRAGDRFFYENGRDTGFTLAQLNQIRKASISRLFCDNGNNIRSMQPHGFERINGENNVLPCESLPAIDLRLWQENPKGGLGSGGLGGGNVGGSGFGQSHYNFAGSDYFLKKK